MTLHDVIKDFTKGQPYKVEQESGQYVEFTFNDELHLAYQDAIGGSTIYRAPNEGTMWDVVYHG